MTQQSDGRRAVARILVHALIGLLPSFLAMDDRLDLRGVRCPLNWAKAKVRLEGMLRGSTLELVIDDPKGARDIPRAAEAEGYAVVDVVREPPCWRLFIQK